MRCTQPAARTTRRACVPRWHNSASSRKSIAQPLLLPRLECPAELVGERSEPLRRRSIPAFGVLADFCSLLRVQDGLRAQTDPAARRVDLEHDDLDVAADGKRSSDIRLL